MSVVAHGPRRRRFVPFVWIASAAAAVLLVLGVTGTLGDWTSAIVTNQGNRAGTTQAVALTELGPDSSGASTTCASTASATNSFTCTTINKYGNNGVDVLDMAPGSTKSTTVTLTNSGGAAGTTFTLGVASCASAFQSPLSGTPASPDTLCESLQVGVICTGGATLNIAPGPMSAFTGGSLGGLGQGATTTCVFTVSLPSNASPLVAGQTATQDLTWTLGA